MIKNPIWDNPKEKPDSKGDGQPDGKHRDTSKPSDSPRRPKWTATDMEAVRLATLREWNRRHPDDAVFEWRVGMEVEGLGRVDEETTNYDNTKKGIVVLVSDGEDGPVRREVDRVFGDDVNGRAYRRRRVIATGSAVTDAVERQMGMSADADSESKAESKDQPTAMSEEDRLRVSHGIDKLIERWIWEDWREEARIATQREWNRRHPDAKILEWGYYMRSPRKLGVQWATTDFIVMLERNNEPRERMFERATGRDITEAVHHVDFQWRKCLMAVEDAYRAIWEAHQDEIPYEVDEDEDRLFSCTSKERIEDMHRIRETILRVEDGAVPLTEEERQRLDEAKAALDEIWEEAGPMWTRLTTMLGRITRDYSEVDKHSPEYLMSQGFCKRLHKYSHAIGMQFMLDPRPLKYDRTRTAPWYRGTYDDPRDHWLDGTVEEDIVTGEVVKFDMAYCWSRLDDAW